MALCERKVWQVVAELVDSRDYRATKAPKRGQMVNPSGERADRPGLLALLDRVESGDIDAVVCWRDDRLVRHPRVAVALEDALDLAAARRKGCGKVEIYDATGAPIDRFTLSIKATIWREENKRKAERTKMGRIATLQAGRWPGVYDRLGYDLLKEEGKRGRAIVLGNDDEVRTVQDIYNWYDQGLTVRKIRQRLIGGGRQSKRDGKKLKRQKHQHRDWALAVVNGILRAEDYTGKATWRFGDGTQYCPEIPRIIEPEQWRRVQDRIERNKKLATRNARGIYLLQGITKCGECGGGVSVNADNFYYATAANGERPAAGTLLKPLRTGIAVPAQHSIPTNHIHALSIGVVETWTGKYGATSSTTASCSQRH